MHPVLKRAIKAAHEETVEKMIRGGSKATAERFAQVRAAIAEQPKRRQHTSLARRLKRAETYLNRSIKRVGKKPKKEFYSPIAGRTAGGGMNRPRTLPEMRAFASDARSAARTSGEAQASRKIERYFERSRRFADLAAARLAQWETTKRPPKGFRRGK